MQLAVNGTRLWFDVEGPAIVADGRELRRRPTVVLVHGGPGVYDHAYFKPDFGRLAYHAQVVYLDLRGHGHSEWGSAGDWTFEACADDIRAFCDALGIERPVVLGHSLGGIIALVYGGISYSRQRSLIGLGPILTTVTEQKSIPLSPFLGAILVVGGSLS